MDIYKKNRVSLTLYDYMNDITFEPFNYLLLKNIYRCVAIFTHKRIFVLEHSPEPRNLIGRLSLDAFLLRSLLKVH